MSNKTEIKSKIDALYNEINFIENNLKYLDDNNIKYLLVNHGSKYSCIIEVNNNLSLISEIVNRYPTNKDLKNNIGSAGGKSWINKSPFLIKCNPFNAEYSHLDHHINVTYKVKNDFEINLKVNIKLLDNLDLFSQPTEETKHFKRDYDRKYETIVKLKDTSISKVLFYGNQFYYYANNTLELKTITDILHIKDKKDLRCT